MDISEPIDWSAFPGPIEYVPGDVPAALRAVERVTEDDWKSVYNRFFNAIGHNHSGTLYPAAEGTIRPVLGIALSGSRHAAWTAAEILIDLLGSFVPLAEYDVAIDRQDIRSRMRAAVAPSLGALVRADGIDERQQRLLAELLSEDA